jgi:putative transposase
MEAFNGPRTNEQIAREHAMHLRKAAQLTLRPVQINQCKRLLCVAAHELLTRGQKSKDKKEGQAKEAELFQLIGRLQMQLQWLPKNLSSDDCLPTLQSAGCQGQLG